MKKHNDFLLLSMVAIMYATVCMETDIYVPAFPDMKVFFETTADTIQQVLSLNFIGICLGSLLFGPFSDSFGRRTAILSGLVLFSFASWSCCLVTDFQYFLFFRFLQGVGAAAPMVITFAILLEKYEPKRVAQLCGALNLFITGAMAAAPILGSYLNIHFGWLSTFTTIAVLATVSLIGSWMVIPETLPSENRNAFSLPGIIKNYGTVLTSFPYMAAACVCYFMFAGLIVFTANLSLIFIDYLAMPKEIYGWFQASVPAAFAFFSFLSVWIIGRFGTDKTKHTGVIVTLAGASLLMLTAIIQPNPYFICGAMIIFTIGITLAAPIYGMESANVYPDMRGIATGMSNSLRHVIVAGIVGLGSYAFNGSIMPVATLIAILASGAVILAIALTKQVAVKVFNKF